MSRRVNIYDAKAHLSSLLAEVERTGEPVIICKHNRPIADLVPHRETSPEPLPPDPALAGAVFIGDPCAPLSVEDWPEELR